MEKSNSRRRWRAQVDIELSLPDEDPQAVDAAIHRAWEVADPDDDQRVVIVVKEIEEAQT
jgi:hypothetical protein